MAADSDNRLVRLLEHEQRLFDNDYDHYYVEGESKPKSIGAPFLLKHPSSKKGALLIHGLMAAPEEVREWAECLYSKGYSVYAPRLAGHGTSAVDLSGRRYPEWLNSVDRGYDILNSICEHVVIGGFSTGAGLALFKAIYNPEKFDAVISISAPLQFKSLSAGFVEMLHAWNVCTKVLGLKGAGKVYARNHPDNPHINYARCPIKGIAEVRALMRNVYKSLPFLLIPVLIMQGDNDPKVSAGSGQKIFKRLKNANSYYKSINYHEHGIIRGEIAREVFGRVDTFLNTVFPDIQGQT